MRSALPRRRPRPSPRALPARAGGELRRALTPHSVVSPRAREDPVRGGHASSFLRFGGQPVERDDVRILHHHVTVVIAGVRRCDEAAHARFELGHSPWGRRRSPTSGPFGAAFRVRRRAIGAKPHRHVDGCSVAPPGPVVKAVRACEIACPRGSRHEVAYSPTCLEVAHRSVRRLRAGLSPSRRERTPTSGWPCCREPAFVLRAHDLTACCAEPSRSVPSTPDAPIRMTDPSARPS